MADEPKELSDLEKEICEGHRIYSEALQQLRLAEHALKNAVGEYRERRVVLQQQAWENRGIAYCVYCEQMFPIDETSLVYIEEKKHQGEFDPRRSEKDRKILRLCAKHAREELKKPNGNGTGFQCHKVVQIDGAFHLNLSLGLIPLDDTKPISIEIQKTPITKEFQFGKDIRLRGPLNDLIIDEVNVGKADNCH